MSSIDELFPWPGTVPPEASALIASARRISGLLSTNADACERERRIVDANLSALVEADLFRVIVPKRLGGHGASMSTQIAVSAELARACGSTSWIQTLANVTTWAAWMLPPAGQAEVFAGAAPPRVCGVLAPTGVARAVPGGYRVDGKWAYTSGVLHSTWFSGGVIFQDAAGAVLGQGVVYIPIAELEIEDTWRVAGMRGTGSNTTIARDVFVPHTRALGGEFVSGVHDAERPEMEPCERWPLPSVLALVLSGPPLGMAQCAFDAVLGNVGQRGVSYTSYARQADSAALLQNLGEAALELETAKLHVFRAAAELDAVAAGRDMSSLALARVRGACGLASRALRSAMDGLVSIGGASSFAEGSVVQRQWRDLNMATRHAFVATGVSFEAYGRELAGREAIYNFV